MAVVEVGAEFAGYRIESRLGRGGMGTVFLAEQLRLHRRVALKILSGDLAEDEGFRERFLQESELAASLDHPNIIPVYDAGEVDGVAYIAMRYVAGTDLAELIAANGPLAPQTVGDIVGQVASALDAAHGRGLVHRDVKPSNILVADGRGETHVYLADFGITKRLDAQAGLTATGQFFGTVDYTAPEQLQGGAIDGRADEYSLGCVAFEALTGSKPFPGENEVATMWSHVQAPRPRVSERNPAVPARLDGVVARAMARAPEERYATCREFGAALRAALAEAVPVRSRGAAVRRNLVALTTLGVGVAAIATFLVLARSGDRGSPPPARTRAEAGVVALDVDAVDPVATADLPGVGPLGPSDRGSGVHPRTVGAGAGAVWAVSRNGLHKIDPSTGRAELWTEIPSGDGSVVAGEAGVFVTSSTVPRGGIDEAGDTRDTRVTLYSVDPGAKGARGYRWDIGVRRPHLLELGGGFLWVASGEKRELLKIAADTGEVVDRLTDFSFNLNGNAIDVTDDSLWVTSLDTVTRLDLRTLDVMAELEVTDAGGISVSGDTAWVVNTDARIGSGKVVPIDVDSGQQIPPIELPLGSATDWVEADDDRVWVADGINEKIYEIDAQSRRFVEAHPVAFGAQALALTDDRLWASFYY